ncbi:Transformer-2 protein alpha [Coemansia sp. RSA 552]|nr:Transformer-2 protein alpha [Coemansia sp. RSA 552]
MSRDNPILPSEPLALQPDLIAAAVLAEGAGRPEQAESDHQLSPRSASKVRRRMDIRNYGRSESPTSVERRHYHQSPRRHHHESPRQDDRRSHSYRRDSYYDRRESRGSADRQPDADEHKDKPTPTRVLGIFGMSKFTSEQNLRELFGRYGPVERVHVIRDPHEGRSRGFAFVNMEDVGDAQKAREAISDTMIHERKVRVDYSFTNRAHSPTPGKYKGQDTASRHMGRNSHRYAPPPPSHRTHPRRRANSRDRRRRDHPYHRPHNDDGGDDDGDSYPSRSKSPGNRSSFRPSDYRRSSRYGERSRNYDGRRSSGHRRASRSPPPPPPPPPASSHRQYSYERERDYDRPHYTSRTGTNSERYPRDRYHSSAAPNDSAY